MTGKKARVEEIPLEEFNTLGLHWLEQTREMFRYTQRVGGRYFGKGVENDVSAAQELKAAYVTAIAVKKDADLRKWRDWLAENVLNAAEKEAKN